MEQRLTAVTLGVADLQRARHFYEKGLGWSASLTSNKDVVFFQANGLVIALWGRANLAKDANLIDEGGGFSGIVLAHNARSREGVDAVLAKAGQAGARILKPGQETFWGGYAGYFADPDGHMWEVAWNPFWPLDDAGNVKLPK
jgi:catechol 2,3-dioxygenase-like lactoylglutathione lyase family enzyme